MASERRLDKTKVNNCQYGAARGEYREAAKISIVKSSFTCVLRVAAGRVEHTLWAGTLSDGRDQFVACIGHSADRPVYTKSFPSRDEAREFFLKFEEVL